MDPKTGKKGADIATLVIFILLLVTILGLLCLIRDLQTRMAAFQKNMNESVEVQ